MSLLVLPAGKTLREIADSLGVPVEELNRHARLGDIEAPLKREERVQVPDGFLRSRQREEELKDAVTSQSALKGGMNTWLAMDIEQKRTRAAGGMKGGKTREHDLLALDEARHSFERFDAASNELVIDLCHVLTAAVSIDVRARAFGLQSLAFAHRGLRFGEPQQRSQPQALSAAKSAIVAAPKLPDAHLGLGLALSCSDEPADLLEAENMVRRALELEPNEVTAWVGLGALLLRLERPDEADAAARQALELKPQHALALELMGVLAERERDLAGAEQVFSQAAVALPTYANPLARIALLEHRRGAAQAAKLSFAAALDAATTAPHKLLIEQSFSAGPLVYR